LKCNFDNLCKMPTIDSYGFGHIKIDGKSYYNDVIIFPEKVSIPWWRKEGHKLHADDLKPIFDYMPGVLIVGTGSSGFMEVPEETRRYIEKRNIGLVVEKTKAACDTYNRIRDEKVVAALHLTC